MNNNNYNEIPDKVYSLDVLRGIAAIAVVFWHWQHFFYVAGKPVDFNVTKQPFFNVFSFFYMHGQHAVELFFCISGFVFFWLYQNKILTNRENAKSFFIKRFSRLYPLYIITFIIVSFLQLAYYNANGSFFVYQINDSYHALLNIFMIPAWGFESGFSFNGPVWSVSIEVLLYIIFFIVCKNKTITLISFPAMIIIGTLIKDVNYKISPGLICFFIGGVSFYVSRYLLSKFSISTCTLTSLALLAISIITISITQQNSIYVVYSTAFPALIASLFFTGLKFNGIFEKIRLLGDISYSSYLIHFPLQILFSLSVKSLGFGSVIFTSKKMMIFFFAVLVTLSLLSHKMFEIKAQNYIRNRFLRRG